jgi:hypothetical protein
VALGVWEVDRLLLIRWTTFASVLLSSPRFPVGHSSLDFLLSTGHVCPALCRRLTGMSLPTIRPSDTY